jgi:hypothetical protein
LWLSWYDFSAFVLGCLGVFQARPETPGQKLRFCGYLGSFGAAGTAGFVTVLHLPTRREDETTWAEAGASAGCRALTIS